VSGECWVCGTVIASGQASVPARGVPHRLRAFEGKLVHLRCQGDWNEAAALRARNRAPARRTKTPLALGEPLFAEDVAAARGISPRQARRWMRKLEERYGVAVVGHVDGRRGPRRYTTAAALQAIGPCLQSDDDALRERMAELEVRIERLEAGRSTGSREAGVR
jgi:transposase-like protein